MLDRLSQVALSTYVIITQWSKHSSSLILLLNTKQWDDNAAEAHWAHCCKHRKHLEFAFDTMHFFFLIMLNVVSYGHQFRMTWHLVKAVMIREENNHCGALWSRRSGWLPSLHGFIYGSSFALWLRWIKYNILLAKMPVWNSLLNTVIYSIYYVLVHIHRQTHFNEDESLLSADSQPASHCFSHVHKFFVKEYFKAKIQTECRAVIWRKTILLSYVIYPLSYTHTPSLFQHLPYETPQGGYKKKKIKI